MNKIYIKISSIFVVILLCASGLATASHISKQDIKTGTSENSLIKTDEKTKTITIYKYTLDGSITPITIEITQKKGQKLEDAIINKCNELLNNDIKLQKSIQKYINNTNIPVSKIKSHGRGFHLKMKIRFKLGKGIKISPILPPYFIGGIKIPIIYCRYTKDAKANTSITPLTGENKETIYIEGNHTIYAFGFIGYTTWIGHISRTPFDILPRTFAGYTLLVNYKKL